MQDTASIDDILQFWFGELNEHGSCRDPQGKLWFGYDEDTDRDIRARFGPLIEQAVVGTLDHWQQDDAGLLALVLLLDQLTRNIYRGSPEAFCGDARALELCRAAVASGRDRTLPTIHRVFLYIPYEHAEDPEAQDAGVALFDSLLQECPEEVREEVAEYRRYMVAHQEVIARFGRFPHRNEILGRSSTPEELAYLEKHGGF